MATTSTSDQVTQAVTALEDWGFGVTGDTIDEQRTWIKNNQDQTHQRGSEIKSVRDIIKELFGSSNVNNWGTFSYSNMGENEDIINSLKNIDSVLTGIGTAPTAAYPAPAEGVQQVIPAGAGATIVINIYPGTAAPVQVAAPAAYSPGQAQPAASVPTMTIDEQESKLANEIELVKSLKEKVADKLQQLEILQNELQLQAKQAKMAMEKELKKNKDEG